MFVHAKRGGWEAQAPPLAAAAQRTTVALKADVLTIAEKAKQEVFLVAATAVDARELCHRILVQSPIAVCPPRPRLYRYLPEGRRRFNPGGGLLLSPQHRLAILAVLVTKPARFVPGPGIAPSSPLPAAFVLAAMDMEVALCARRGSGAPGEFRRSSFHTRHFASWNRSSADHIRRLPDWASLLRQSRRCGCQRRRSSPSPRRCR
jgi:hypothetical protein